MRLKYLIFRKKLSTKLGSQKRVKLQWTGATSFGRNNRDGALFGDGIAQRLCVIAFVAKACSAGRPSLRVSAWVMSVARPGVRINGNGLPGASTTSQILFVRTPRDDRSRELQPSLVAYRMLISADIVQSVMMYSKSGPSAIARSRLMH
jgi:hypothetical protein